MADQAQSPQPSPTQPSQQQAPKPAAPGASSTTSGTTSSQPATATTTATVAPQPKKGIFGLIIGALLFVWGALVAFGTSMAGEGGQGSQLASLLGKGPKEAIQTWIMFTTLYAAVLGGVLLLWLLITLIRRARLAKEDPSRKSTTIKMVLAMLLLFMTVVGWLMTYIFLTARSETFGSAVARPPIITDPANTIGLSAPVTITFDAAGFESTINVKRYRIISYLWDFGDNTTGTGSRVSHEYTDKGTKEGKFDVSLQVTMEDNTTGKQAVSNTNKTVVSIKNIKPQVQFTATPEKGAAPLSVAFDASDSRDTDGQITAYGWDVNGDGQFDDATGKTANYTFQKSGKYTVGLKLTDNSGDTNTATKVIDVSDTFAVKSVIDVTGEPDGKFLIGKSYLFDAKRSSSPNGKIDKYSWNFGDNTGDQKSRSVSHAFQTAGTYQVTLTVTDIAGAPATSTKKITITEPGKKPTSLIQTTPAAVNGKVVGPAPLAVSFDATQSAQATNNEIVEYAWDFNGDGNYDKFGAQASYTFDTKGTYQVTLRLTDGDNNETVSTITVEATPPGVQAKISATPIAGIVPLTVKFDASASTYLDGQIVGYEWDFGDGTPKRQDAAKISYKYVKVGTYKTTVTALGNDQNKNTPNILITFHNVPVKACYSANKKEATAPAELVFNANCSTGTIAKYNWDLDGNGQFDDGAGPQVSKTFADPGTYQVGLEVTDVSGVVDVFTDTIIISAP